MDELQKIRLLKQAGLDPKFHDIDDNGDVHEYNTPVRQDTPQVVQDTQLPSTGMGSAWRAAKRSLVPSAAGLATTGGLLTAMSGPEMASGVGLVPGLASLAGGMGMSYLASKLQDKVAPLSPEEVAQSKADYEQHPYSTLVGEAAPSLLFLRPDNPMPVVKGLSQYARAGTALSKPVQEQLLSMAANAGINSTIDAGMQAMGDEPMDYKRLAAAVLGGALLSKPWLAGKKVGLPDHEFNKPAFVDQTKPKVEQELVVEKPSVKDPAIQGAVQDFSATQAAKDIVPPESITFNKNQAPVAKAPVVEKPVVPAQEPVVDSMVGRIKQTDETGTKTPYDKEFQEKSSMVPEEKPSPFDKMHDVVDKAETEVKEKEIPNKDFKDARYQTGSKLVPDDRTFVTESEKEFNKEKPFNLTPDKEGNLSVPSVLSKIRGLPKVEQELLNQSGFNSWIESKKGKVSSKEAAQWVKDNGPKVEVHSYGMEGKVSEAKAEYDRMTHEWLDSYQGSKRSNVLYAISRRDEGASWDAIVSEAKDPGINQQAKMSIHANELYSNDEFRQTVDKYNSLMNKVRSEPEDKSPRATSAYETVSPKDVRKYPVTRVDVVLPSKFRERIENFKRAEGITDEELEGINIERQDAGLPNIGYNNKDIIWQQDNLHENLPNTLGWAAIQYEPHPSGTGKIAHIYEAQSRWGQEVNKHLMDAKNKGEDAYRKAKIQTPNHPLLEDYNRLILKAAIDQARKDGATHIAISDAETAMMTEGHDNTSSRHGTEGEIEYSTKAEAQEDASTYEDNNPVITERNGKWYLRLGLDQESGMRQNYDKTLPDIMRKLTGSEGERMSLGEHKNAFNRATSIDRANRTTSDTFTPRENLIFKNPDGTPKTDASAMVFPLDKIKAKLDEQGGKFSMTGKFQKESALASDLQSKLNEAGVPESDWRKTTVEDFLKLAEKRGIKGEVGKVENEGQQMAGVALLKARVAKINPEAVDAQGKPTFGLDTGNHEIAHIFKNDLKEHGSTYEKKLVAEGEKLAHAELSDAQKKITTPDEALVEAIGRQSIEAKHGNAMVEWFKDFWSHIKTKFGNATEEDYRRILSRKLLDDPAFHESNLGAGELKLRIAKIDKLEESIAKATDEAEKTKLSAEREKLMDKIGEGLDKDKAEAALYSIRSKIGAGNNQVDESFFRPLESMIASVKRLHPQLGEALEERARVNRHLRGEFSDHYMYLAGEGMKSKGWTKEDFDAVNKFRYDKTHKLPVTELTPTQKEINTEIFEKQSHEVGKKSINSGQLVKDERDPEGYRKMILSTNYHPDMPSKDVAHVLRQEINSPQREEYINKIAQHWFEMGQKFKLDYKLEQAVEDARNYAAALGGSRTQDSAVKFNALRRAKGMGLPWELTEQDGLSVVKRYGERSARDMAHFLVVEQNPTVRSMLNEPDQFGSKKDNIKDLKDYSGTQEVRDVMNYVGQQKSVREQTIQSVSRAIVGGFIGPVSGMRNIVSSWVQSMPYKEMKDFGVGINSLVKSMQDGWESSFKSGVNRTNILDTEFQPSSVNQITDSFTKIGNTLAKYQGRNLMEQFSRAWRFTEGQLLAEAKLGRAIDGDIESINWLEKFGKGNQPVENLIKRGKLAADELDNIAANYVERVEGTYDERGLPSVAVQGTLSPFLSLSKWSIEKSNTIYQDVVKPLLNREPGSMEKFLLYSLGSVLGGEAIHALADEMNKKLSYDTDLKEVHASRFSSPEDYAIATVNMLQLAGLAGVVSDFAKIGMNTAQGKPAQGYNYPLAQFVGDNVAGTLRDYAVALDNGQPVFDTTLNAAVEVLRNTVQSARIAYNWSHPEETEQKNIRRDLRTYKEFTGQPAGEIGASKNSVLAGKDVRDFKQTTDLKEAQQELPELLRNIVAKSRNPEELKQHLESLRVMPVSEFPSLESSPQAFGEFVQFLTDKYGPQRTSELIQYYQKRQLSQEAKKSLVPTVR